MVDPASVSLFDTVGGPAIPDARRSPTASTTVFTLNKSTLRQKRYIWTKASNRRIRSRPNAAKRLG